MDGLVFYRHATDYHRHQAMNRFKKLERQMKRSAK